jgi:NAD-dependent SIR2 family protein deacetylase
LENSLLKSLETDSELCDLVIVMGTSLSVGGPVISFLNQISHKTPQILINLRAVNPPKGISNGFDLSLLGDCDVIVSYLLKSLNWGTPLFSSLSLPH